jgi:hypothetical protein
MISKYLMDEWKDKWMKATWVLWFLPMGTNDPWYLVGGNKGPKKRSRTLGGWREPNTDTTLWPRDNLGDLKHLKHEAETAEAAISGRSFFMTKNNGNLNNFLCRNSWVLFYKEIKQWIVILEFLKQQSGNKREKAVSRERDEKEGEEKEERMIQKWERERFLTLESTWSFCHEIKVRPLLERWH